MTDWNDIMRSHCLALYLASIAFYPIDAGNDFSDGLDG